MYNDKSSLLKSTIYPLSDSDAIDTKYKYITSGKNMIF